MEPKEELEFWIVYSVILVVAALGLGVIIGLYIAPNDADSLNDLNKPIKPDSLYTSSSIIKNNYDTSFKGGTITTCFANTQLAIISKGDSMVPSIYSGQRPLYREVTNTSTLKVGDIITFAEGTDTIPGVHNVVSHRIIEIGEDAEGAYFITQGDNNPVPDGKIRPSQIEYVVAGIIF